MIFYQSNFCPECGNETENRAWWRNRYFCDYCATRLRKKVDLAVFAILLIGVSSACTAGLMIFKRKPDAIQCSPSGPPLVSAQETVLRLKPAVSVSPAGNFVCGAKTKKGTPCQRKVAREGERCFQHQGIAVKASKK